MTAPEPTQPLTDRELAEIQSRADAFEDRSIDNGVGTAYDSASDVPRLLTLVNQFRTELADVDAALKCTGIQSKGAQGVRDILHHFGRSMQDERTLRAENTAQAEALAAVRKIHPQRRSSATLPPSTSSKR